MTTDQRPVGRANKFRLSATFGLLLAVALLTLAACSPAGGTGSGWTFAPVGPTPHATPGESPAGTPAESPAGSPATGNVIELDMTANLRYARDGQEVNELAFVVGEEYTFVVDNVAGFSHDIFLGPPDQLAASDNEGLPGIPEWETGVREFTWTATEEAEGWEFGCTVPGHYQGGMRGQIVLEQP
ncbi:MAG TPA: hypothetical protein VM305_06425 [Candidatus Limnocylindrales bacterium]|nr:hypothetical protein [Candidatus Limnocylindrales bacterium]